MASVTTDQGCSGTCSATDIDRVVPPTPPGPAGPGGPGADGSIRVPGLAFTGLVALTGLAAAALALVLLGLVLAALRRRVRRSE